MTTLHAYLRVRCPSLPAGPVADGGFVRHWHTFPLSGLMVSRYRREEAFPGSHRDGNCTHHRRSSYQERQGRPAASAPHPQAVACFEGTGRTHSSTPRSAGVAGSGSRVRRTRRRMVVGLTGIPCRWAMREATIAPTWSPSWRCSVARRSERRAEGATTSGSGSENVACGQVGWRQTKRRTWRCKVTGTLAQGKSATVR